MAGLAAVLGASWRPIAFPRVQIDDRNHDGRPDVWRFFDAQGRLTRIDIDTNFDGRPDQEEQYQQDALTRRTSDRNFDQRVDLVEDFDPATHQRIRSLVDVDFDGRGDLLVLFADGRPVHAEWAERAGPRTAMDSVVPDGQLTALEDPFTAAGRLVAAHPRVPSVASAVATLQALSVEPIASAGPKAPPRAVASLPSLPGSSCLSSSVGPRAPPAITPI